MNLFDLLCCPRGNTRKFEQHPRHRLILSYPDENGRRIVLPLDWRFTNLSHLQRKTDFPVGTPIANNRPPDVFALEFGSKQR
jgi:hypothetical protein